MLILRRTIQGCFVALHMSGTAQLYATVLANAACQVTSSLQSLLQGRPVQSVQWGAWAEAGMAAGQSGLLSRLARQGYGALMPAAGLAVLRSALQGVQGEMPWQLAQLAAQLCSSRLSSACAAWALLLSGCWTQHSPCQNAVSPPSAACCGNQRRHFFAVIVTSLAVAHTPVVLMDAGLMPSKLADRKTPENHQFKGLSRVHYGTNIMQQDKHHLHLESDDPSSMGAKMEAWLSSAEAPAGDAASSISDSAAAAAACVPLHQPGLRLQFRELHYAVQSRRMSLIMLLMHGRASSMAAAGSSTRPCTA